MNTQYINLNMTPSGVLPVLHCSQYDVGRPLGVVVYDGSAEMDLDDYTVTIEATRTDGTPITAAVTTDGSIGAFVTTATMTNKEDIYPAQLVVIDGSNNRVASLPFMMKVVKAAMDENSEAVQENKSLYQQYTVTMQSLIAAIRASLNAEIAQREATDTTLQGDIDEEASTRAAADTLLNTRINEIIAPTGGAPSAAEVTDARIGADGTVYSTLGSAIRGQVTDINSVIDASNPFTAKDELTAIPFEIAENRYAIRYTTGAVMSVSSLSHTNYIDVSMYECIEYKRIVSTASEANYGIAFYDENRNYIYGISAIANGAENGYETEKVHISGRMKYVRCSTRTDTDTYGAFQIKGVPKIFDIVRETDNLWEFGDVNINGGLGYDVFPLHLAAGSYKIKANAIGKYNRDDPKFQLYGTQVIGVANASDRVANIFIPLNSETEQEFTLASDANSAFFVSGPSAGTSTGGHLFIKDIEIVKSTNTKAHNIPLSAIDYNVMEDIGFSDIIDYSDTFVKGQYIVTNGETADITSPVTPTPSESYSFGYCVVPCEEGDKFRIVAYGQSGPRQWAVLASDGTVIAVSNARSGYGNGEPLVPFDLTIPAGGKLLVVNHLYVGGETKGYKPQVIKLTGINAVDKLAEKAHLITPVVKPEWKRQIVAAYNSILVKNVGGVVSRSYDCGITWGDGLDVSAVGLIKSYHLYSNGCLGFFTQTKAYYTEDFTTYSEATCYESDGTTVYTPASIDNFYTIFDVAQRQFINGQDMYVFGNYVVNGENTNPPTRKLLWYSIDNGHTYKIAYEFGLNDTIPIRHVHSVVYYAPENVHIVTTGDSNATQCWVLGFTYDTVNDSWSVVKYNESSSRDYKWAGLAIWGDELFFTYDNTPGELRKCKFADIGDVTKHETILSGTTTDAVAVIIGQRGDMVVTTSHYRSDAGAVNNYALTADKDCRTIYYSSDRKSWSKIFIDPQIADSYTVASGFLPPTSDGHIICGVHGDDTANWGKLPSLYIDECLKSAGFNDAFKPI